MAGGFQLTDSALDFLWQIPCRGAAEAVLAAHGGYLASRPHLRQRRLENLARWLASAAARSLTLDRFVVERPRTGP